VRGSVLQKEYVMIGFAIALAVVAALLVIRGARRKKELAPDAGVAAPIDELVAHAIGRGVAARSSLTIDAVESAITATPEPEVVARVEELVKGVEVSYERTPLGGPVAEAKGRLHAAASLDVRVTVRFEDGANVDESRTLPEASLPEEIRAELHRTGAARAFRAWDFPWKR
jgi:hypothetical protein